MSVILAITIVQFVHLRASRMALIMTSARRGGAEPRVDALPSYRALLLVPCRTEPVLKIQSVHDQS